MPSYDFALILSRPLYEDELDPLFDRTHGAVTVSIISEPQHADRPGNASCAWQGATLAAAIMEVVEHVEASAEGLHVLQVEADPLLIQAEKRLISQAEELIVLADSSKFAKKAGLILCGLNRVSTVITDTEASDAAVQLLEQSGVRVVTVEREALPVQMAPSSFNAPYGYEAVGMFQPEATH